MKRRAENRLNIYIVAWEASVTLFDKMFDPLDKGVARLDIENGNCSVPHLFKTRDGQTAKMAPFFALNPKKMVWLADFNVLGYCIQPVVQLAPRRVDGPPSTHTDTHSHTHTHTCQRQT